ncbi:MAG: asparagine--tRNA ligase [Tissierellia bacterium]|nr:asparagine--tRNA ligase [Tissierellia bacterium]
MYERKTGKITLIRDIFKNQKDFANNDLVLTGWVRKLRSSKNVAFIELNDGTHFNNLQIVIDSEKFENFSELEKLPLSTALIVKGKLVENNGKVEVQASSIEIEGESTTNYPIQNKRHSFEYMRTVAHLRPRANTFNAVFRARSVLSYAIHKFFQERGFVYVHTPIITGFDGEGAGEMFRVSTIDMKTPPLTDSGEIDFSQDFFGKETNLTVTGQLQGEAFCHAFRDIYTFGPTFRAEDSNTARHAAEFWMVEPEIAFGDLEDNMSLAWDMLKYIIQYSLDELAPEMEFFNSFIDKGLIERLDKVVNSEYKVITYTEAIDILKKSNQDFKFPVEWGLDLQTEHERYLSEKYVGGPVFVIDYPKDFKAFYMRMNDDNKTVAAMDLLVPGVGEIVGGSQREERLDYLEKRINEIGFNPEDYSWYLDLRRYGGTIHSGYGLGFERALMYITGMQNIRDVLPFPRTVNSAEF